MKLAIEMGPITPDKIQQTVEWVQFAERLGVDMAFAAEAWWSDAVTPLAFLADKTHTIKLATGIMQTTARTPAMTAMSALTLHDLSGGRFVLGLGASGPQVVEGLHSTRYHRPLARLRETVEICRMIFAGKKVQYQGKVFQMPLPDSEGKAIKVAHEPVDIPIYLATLGPNALRYTGEAANGWLGTSFSPDQPDAHLGYLREGATKARRTLDDLDLCVSVRIELGDDLEAMIAKRKPAVAFNMGGMGSAETNFYNDAFKRAGYAEDALAIQQLWLDGKRDEAARRVPDAMVTQFQALGDTATVTQRLRAYRDAGVTTLKLGLDSAGPIGPARYELLEQIIDITGAL
ncbi:LLM class flavin-dependent oxidoreductase [Pseudomonadales bacterium]|mgnify:CR=1 FL=1|jgi:F420-dependent oxidoreductase-like protein|nr:LLM class flavin-dependent oxidoreductase [Pseudomonadales bacterium]